MKWQSLLRNPDDLPQRINKYDESEDVMVIEKIIRDEPNEKLRCDFQVLENHFYYGHWEPNGEEGWRMRGKDYSDCGKFGGFDTDISYYKYIQCIHSVTLEDLEESSEEYRKFIIENCPYDERTNAYITRSIVGWSYFPNEDEFINENKEFILK